MNTREDILKDVGFSAELIDVIENANNYPAYDSVETVVDSINEVEEIISSSSFIYSTYE